MFDHVIFAFSPGACWKNVKSVSMRKPGRTRQVIQLKSPILLKLGINVKFGE